MTRPSSPRTELDAGPAVPLRAAVDALRGQRAPLLGRLREQVGALMARTARTVRPPLRLDAGVRSLLLSDLYGVSAVDGAAPERPSQRFERLVAELLTCDPAAARDARLLGAAAQLGEIERLEAAVRAGDGDATARAMAGAISVELLLQALARDGEA